SRAHGARDARGGRGRAPRTACRPHPEAARRRALEPAIRFGWNVIDPPLLVVTDRRQAVRPLAEILEAVFAAGCRWASVREKDLAVGEQIALVHELRPIARRWSARLIMHGDATTAAAAGADGVHLGAGSDAAKARARLGAGAL